jgi:hypothetical protein
MEHHAPALFVALEQSGFAAAIRQSLWIYPAANVGHILALFGFAGAIVVMDLRLIGAFAPTSPGRLIGHARRFALVAFAGLAGTGFLLFSAEASHVVLNLVFLIKMAFVAAGLLNIALYEFVTKRTVEALAPCQPMPASARMAGYASLGIWLAVAACGRSIAYF